MGEDVRKLRLAWFTEFNSRRWDEGALGWGYGSDWRDVQYNCDMARMLDRGMFDLLIAADATAIPTVEDSIELNVRYGEAVGFLSPQLVMAAMATSTRNLGLVATLSTLTYAPYALAREMATLDALSKGRAGWNIVTSIDHRAAQNFGLDKLPDRTKRYDAADEFVEICERLWGSWDPDSVVMDVDKHVFANPEGVHEIDYEGEYYSCRGPLVTLPGPQGRPLYVQAGGSPRGLDFAAQHADAVISHMNSVDAMTDYVTEIRERAVKFDRDPHAIKVFFTLKPFLGATAAEAEGKRQRMYEHMLTNKPEAGLLKASIKSGLDLRSLPLDEPLRLEQFEATETGVRGLYHQHYGDGRNPTLREVLAREGMMESLPLVGTASDIADQLRDLMERVDFDGVAIRDGLSPQRVSTVIDELVPELSARGMIRSGFRHSTLRENLFDEDA
jgi:long-chain alkane monooxygenase